ncbi:MAG: ketoacyl-ACP synthase III [Lentisphaerae bacterium]|nr:ketoacyl-ACP synthase III [Lentisphaerota bacterium]
MGIKIRGTGSYAPDKVLTNADLEKMVETNDEWIRTRTGICQRHISAPEQACSDLAEQAARRALDMAGVAPEELSAIIVATITPDHVFPSTACLLQHRLGATKAFGFDLEAACSGLLFSLETARGLMSANAKYRYVLVIGSDKMSAVVNWEDRNTCVLFGDGASALLLENCPGEEDSFLASDLGVDGNSLEILSLPAGGSRNPASMETVENKMHYVHMAGRDVFKLAVNAMVSSCRKVLEEANVSIDQVRWLVPHQANERIMKAVAQRLPLEEERVFMNIGKYGNTSAASIGICLDEMKRADLINPGDYILLTAFGGGLTWGAILIRW